MPDQLGLFDTLAEPGEATLAIRSHTKYLPPESDPIPYNDFRA